VQRWEKIDKGFLTLAPGGLTLIIHNRTWGVTLTIERESEQLYETSTRELKAATTQQSLSTLFKLVYGQFLGVDNVLQSLEEDLRK
jgi:hypothetical protein